MEVYAIYPPTGLLVGFVADQYVAAGLMPASEARQRVRSRLAQCSFSLCVVRDVKVVAGCGVLLAERSTEITCLASKGPAAAVKLLREIALLCEEGRVVTAIVHPDHAAFYAKIAGAVVDTTVDPVPFVDGHPGVRITIDEGIRNSPGWHRHVCTVRKRR